jgi:hypothetical protein
MQNTDLTNAQALAIPIQIVVADGRTIMAKEEGDLVFRWATLRKVLRAPIDVNLLSVHKLSDDNNLICMFEKNGGAIMSKDKVIALLKCSESSNLYLLSTPSKNLCLKTSTISDEDLMLQHLKLGHCSAKALKEITGKHLDLSSCEGCIMGKMTQRQHRRRQNHSRRALQTLHSDTVSACTPGVHGELYFTTIMDEYGSYYYERSQK